MDVNRVREVLAECRVQGIDGQRLVVLAVLVEFPGSAVADIAAAAEMKTPPVHRILKHLEKLGIACSLTEAAGPDDSGNRPAKIGATRERVTRWRLADPWPERLDSSWHSTTGIACLLERQPLVDEFYPTAVDLSKEFGPLSRFTWYRRWPWDATSEYENGWVFLFWSGILDREHTIAKRLLNTILRAPELAAFSHDEYYSNAAKRARPRLLCYLVPDQWQKELVFRATRSGGWEDVVQVRCLADGTVAGPEEVLQSMGWLGRPRLYNSDGGWTLERRLASSLWSKSDSSTAFRLLLAVAEWRDMTAQFGRQYCKVLGDPHRVKAVLGKLYGAGLVDRRLDGNRYRYRLTTRGLNILSRIDWVYGTAVHKNILGYSMDQRIRDHEHGLQSVVGRFLEAQLPCAAGWRYSERWPGGGIDPDAMIRLNRSPLGPGWHCLEV